MYFLIQLMSFYLPVDLVTQPETRVNPVRTGKQVCPALKISKDALQKPSESLLMIY